MKKGIEFHIGKTKGDVTEVFPVKVPISEEYIVMYTKVLKKWLLFHAHSYDDIIYDHIAMLKTFNTRKEAVDCAKQFDKPIRIKRRSNEKV